MGGQNLWIISISGIHLDPKNVVFNAGFRQIAKLLLNSLWGKFGEKIDRSQWAIVTDTKNAYKILYNVELEILSVEQVSENLLQIHYRNRDHFITETPTSSTVIAGKSHYSIPLILPFFYFQLS